MVSDTTLKKEFYSRTITQQKDGPERLFKVKTLLCKGKDLSLPPHESASELAEEFSDHSFGRLIEALCSLRETM